MFTNVGMPETAHYDLLGIKVHELTHFLRRLVSESTAKAGLKCQLQAFRHVEAKYSHASRSEVMAGSRLMLIPDLMTGC